VRRRNFQTVHRSLPRNRSLLKTARECGALFHGLGFLLLLPQLFFEARIGTSTLEQKDNEEKK
jgi:hypothetical protein